MILNISDVKDAIRESDEQTNVVRFTNINKSKTIPEVKGMKISELIENTEQVNELGMTPMGIGQRMATGALAKLGSTTAAANLDVGKRANELNTTFRQWALRSGINLSSVPQKDIQTFMKQQGLPSMPMRQSIYDLNDKATNSALWKAVAQNAYKSSGSAATSAPLGQKYNVGSGSSFSSGSADVLSQIQGMLGSLTPQQRAKLKTTL